MIKQTKKIFKDKGGFSTAVGMLGAVLLFAIIASCGLGITAQIHQITVLDRFADELATKAGEQGRCGGTALEERYAQLVDSTGLSPTVNYEASYYDRTRQLVQYGDPITVSLTMETKVVGFGDFSIPMTLRVKSSEQSTQYWK